MSLEVYVNFLPKESITKLIKTGSYDDEHGLLATGGRVNNRRCGAGAGRQEFSELQTRLAHTLYPTLDYQFIQHPGYHGDRGPVNLFALRTHV